MYTVKVKITVPFLKPNKRILLLPTEQSKNLHWVWLEYFTVLCWFTADDNDKTKVISPLTNNSHSNVTAESLWKQHNSDSRVQNTDRAHLWIRIYGQTQKVACSSDTIEWNSAVSAATTQPPWSCCFVLLPRRASRLLPLTIIYTYNLRHNMSTSKNTFLDLELALFLCYLILFFSCKVFPVQILSFLLHMWLNSYGDTFTASGLTLANNHDDKLRLMLHLVFTINLSLD